MTLLLLGRLCSTPFWETFQFHGGVLMHTMKYVILMMTVSRLTICLILLFRMWGRFFNKTQIFQSFSIETKNVHIFFNKNQNFFKMSQIKIKNVSNFMFDIPLVTCSLCQGFELKAPPLSGGAPCQATPGTIPVATHCYSSSPHITPYCKNTVIHN